MPGRTGGGSQKKKKSPAQADTKEDRAEYTPATGGPSGTGLSGAFAVGLPGASERMAGSTRTRTPRDRTTLEADAGMAGYRKAATAVGLRGDPASRAAGPAADVEGGAARGRRRGPSEQVGRTL